LNTLSYSPSRDPHGLWRAFSCPYEENRSRRVDEEQLRPDIRITKIDSLEEYFKEQAEEEELANQELLPSQKKIVWGSYFLRMSGNVPIFARVYTFEELKLSEINAGAEGEELESILQRAKNIYERGYRTGVHYSQIEPQGEYGDTHISNCWPITQSDFESAQMTGWKLEKGIHQPMMRRIYDEMAKELNEARMKL
jgi:hypothetical protein